MRSLGSDGFEEALRRKMHQGPLWVESQQSRSLCVPSYVRPKLCQHSVRNTALANTGDADSVPINQKGRLPALAALTPIHPHLAVQYQMCVVTQLPHVMLLAATLW